MEQNPKPPAKRGRGRPLLLRYTVIVEPAKAEDKLTLAELRAIARLLDAARGGGDDARS